MKGAEIYIALLRGINVSGQKLIKMDALRKAFESLKFQDVKTYVQSGNVVFSAPTLESDFLSEKIEKMILKKFKFEVSVITRSSSEMKKTFKTNPFLDRKGIDATRLYVTFLSRTPDKKALSNLDRFVTQSEEYHLLKSELFLFCPNSYGKSKLNNNTIEKALGVTATTRNWNTVGNLCQLIV